MIDTQTKIEINKVRYSEQLKSPRWLARREQILKRDGYRCRNCGSTADLQVHHRQYHTLEKNGDFKNPWDYTDRYLITLCTRCHKAGHKMYHVPIFNV